MGTEKESISLTNARSRMTGLTEKRFLRNISQNHATVIISRANKMANKITMSEVARAVRNTASNLRAENAALRTATSFAFPMETINTCRILVILVSIGLNAT